MPDLICFIRNHGYSDTNIVYVSWLDDIRFVSNKDQDSFKLAITSGGSVLEQFSETITDGFVRESSASSTSTVTGLDHLEGKAVDVTSNGVFIGTFTVSGGSITLNTSIINSVIGLPVTSTVQPMKVDISGLGLSVTKKINRAVISVNDTIGGQIGPDTSNLDAIVYRAAGESGDEFPFFSGDREISLPGGYSRQGNIVVRQTQPLPMTVLALTIDIGASND